MEYRGGGAHKAKLRWLPRPGPCQPAGGDHMQERQPGRPGQGQDGCCSATCLGSRCGLLSSRLSQECSYQEPAPFPRPGGRQTSTLHPACDHALLIWPRPHVWAALCLWPRPLHVLWEAPLTLTDPTPPPWPLDSHPAPALEEQLSHSMQHLH